MVGNFYRLYTESVGDLGYIPNSPTGGHSGRKTSHGGRTGYIFIYIYVVFKKKEIHNKKNETAVSSSGIQVQFLK